MDSLFIVQRDDGPKVYGIHQIPELQKDHRRNMESNCGGHLASITSPEEYDMVIRLLQVTLGNSSTTAKVQPSDGMYLGARRESGPNGEFIWGDGSQPFFVNWRDGFPNDEIVVTSNNIKNNGDDDGGGGLSGRIPRKRTVVIHLNDFRATNEQDTQKRRAVVLLPLDYLAYDRCRSHFILQGF